MGTPLTDDDDAHPDAYGHFELRELHHWLRTWADGTVRDVERLVLLRARGVSHGRARALMNLEPEQYRLVNRIQRQAVAAIALAARRETDD